MTVMRFFVGVHRRVPPFTSTLGALPWGQLIHGLTVARWGSGGKPPRGGWAFEEGPSTHAFCAYQHGEDSYRVDAEFPAATQEPFDPLRLPPLTRVWEITRGDIPAGIAAVRRYVGKPYDMGQAVAHALAPMTPPLLAPLVPFHGLRGGGGGDICTEAACRQLAACGGPAKTLADGVLQDDHFPEELAMALRLAAGSAWLREITVTP